MEKKYLSSITSNEQIDVNKKVRYCLARWDDWGFCIDGVECFVWHFKCHTKIMLPYFHHYDYWITEVLKCVVSPSTHEYLCNVSLFFREERYCLICGPPYYKKWVKVKLYDYSRLVDAVTFCNGEKICTLFQEGKLGIIQMIPEITTSTCLSPLTFRAPTDVSALYRNRHLVSWQDQLFLVQRKVGSPSIFEVWEADFETKQFNRVFNLDGFIIFLSGQFSAATSSSLPQENNNVYFTQCNDHRILYAFHVGDQSLSTTKQFGICSSHNSFPLFARSGRAKIQHNTSTAEDKLKKRPSRIKSKPAPVDSNICIRLSLDLQSEISHYLISQEAYMSFRLVCKLWRSVAPPLRWKVVVDGDAAPSYDQDSMWLLSLNQKDGLCTFYNPFRNFNCYMSNNDLVGCEIRYAKDGWLLVSKGKSFFLLEPSPSQKQIIHLPQKRYDYLCDIMSFSASPTNSSGWVIFGIALLNVFQVRISYLRQGDERWTCITRDSEVPFLLSSSSPVYFGEEFCVIGQNGDVGVFGFKDGTPYWVIHKLFQQYSPRIYDACRLFLVQRQDQNVLHSVVVTPQHDVHVYELDFGSNIIVKLVKEVKNWLFFTSEASSVAVCGMNVNVDNAVFFPTFNTCNDYTYYSLKDVAFKVLKDNCTDKTHQKELLNRVWIRCELTGN
ncbi:hypothetical protein KY290_003074 [Solanum tuberosum]|uniref:KIB1-4 beta-propeller domain-containing protein n=1 Tax=Solanum tuberosum TaxID=4113 RepID=A0ABQ7WRW1_SOLTU|nr:hypothetical protein KY285_003042 [Solanum tuberosum]KAH0783476.1 hypothetical protein KY290_003074 [Solanum tuberosum]